MKWDLSTNLTVEDQFCAPVFLISALFNSAILTCSDWLTFHPPVWVSLVTRGHFLFQPIDRASGKSDSPTFIWALVLLLAWSKLYWVLVLKHKRIYARERFLLLAPLQQLNRIPLWNWGSVIVSPWHMTLPPVPVT